MAEFDDETKKKINDMHTAIVQQQTLIDNVVVSKDLCEKKRKEVYETIKDCAETQCEKIEKAGKVSKTALVIATAVGSLIGILIYIISKSL